MNVFYACILTLCLASLTLNANVPISKKPNHSDWNMLLKKHVASNGDVNYKSFQKDRKALAIYLKELAVNSPSDDWSQQEKLAYYINLYNAATVQLVIDNYPLKSIKNLKSPWDKEWIKIGENRVSLGQIEHKILRKMKEPRIHFAINCASYSCPKLFNEAFTPEQIENQLQKAATHFINDPKKNHLSTDAVQLSLIFKWYKEDFTEKASLIAYINSYAEIPIPSNAKINYLQYDWRLNESK